MIQHLANPLPIAFIVTIRVRVTVRVPNLPGQQLGNVTPL